MKKAKKPQNTSDKGCLAGTESENTPRVECVTSFSERKECVTFFPERKECVTSFPERGVCVTLSLRGEGDVTVSLVVAIGLILRFAKIVSFRHG